MRSGKSSKRIKKRDRTGVQEFSKMARRNPKDALIYFWTLLKESKALTAVMIIGGLLIIFDVVFLITFVASPVIRECADVFIISLMLCAGLLVASAIFIGVMFSHNVNERHRGKKPDMIAMVPIEGSPNEFELDYEEEIKNTRCPTKISKFCVGYSILILLIVSLFVPMIILFSVHVNFMTTTVAPIHGTNVVPSILSQKGVKIIREESGVIHITAENEDDLFLAQGWVAAEERLFQMEFQRRAAQGTLSEVFGEDALEFDKLFRTLGIYESAKTTFIDFNTEVPMTTFVEGVNQYIDQLSQLPIEFRILGFKPSHFNTTDLIATGKLMSYSLSMNFQFEILRYNLLTMNKLSAERIDELWPPYPQQGPYIVENYTQVPQHILQQERNFQEKEYERLRNEPTSPHRYTHQSQRTSTKTCSLTSSILHKEFTNMQKWRENMFSPRASNNWVVGPQKSTTGKPILCNDPHLGLEIPNVWLLVHLESPTVELVGAALPTMPGVVIGRNKHVGWAVTNVGADVQDLYIVDVDPVDKKFYWSNGAKYEIVERTETILIKDKQPATLTIKQTQEGPIISNLFSIGVGADIALRWVSLDHNDTTVYANQRIMRSTNIAQLREGLAYYVAPSLNFLFADVEGNFGYQCAGKIPKRQMTHTGKYPVHSNSTLHWQGYHVFEHSPYLLNPNQGFIASANNKVISSQFPLMITNDFDWEDPFRAMRIKEMLTSQSLLSLDDMVAMQKDQKSLVFEGMKPAISKLDTTKLSPLGQLWREHLLKWDGVEDLPSVDATVFQTWFLQLQKVTQPETGFDTWDHPMYFIKVFAGNSSEISAQDLALCKKSAVDCDDFALQAFEAALNSLPKNIPGWGQYHKRTIPHIIFGETPLGCIFNREVDNGGDGYTVNVGPVGASWGASYRQIIDFSNFENSKFITTVGQSGNLYSKYYDNWLQKWRDGEYVSIKTKDYDETHVTTLSNKT